MDEIPPAIPARAPASAHGVLWGMIRGGDARCYGVATWWLWGGVIFGDRSEIEIVRVRCDCGRGGNNWGVGVDVLLGPSKL